jgi:uncharacterized protein
MRVVVDSNVWVSAFRFGGVSEKVIEALIIEDEIYHSQYIQEELMRVLANKFLYKPNDLDIVSKELNRVSTFATPKGFAPTICRDPADNQILHLCQYLAAEILVTGDKDLLILHPFNQTQILSPRTVADRLMV